MQFIIKETERYKNRNVYCIRYYIQKIMAIYLIVLFLIQINRNLILFLLIVIFTCIDIIGVLILNLVYRLMKNKRKKCNESSSLHRVNQSLVCCGNLVHSCGSRKLHNRSDKHWGGGVRSRITPTFKVSPRMTVSSWIVW